MRAPCRPVLLLVAAVVAGLLSAVTGAPAVSSAAPVAITPGAFVGLTPTRVLDTRTGNGAPQGPVAGGRPLHLTVAGRGGVPSSASAVVLTLTVVATGASGYLTAYPTGTASPTTSVVNWWNDQTVAGSATVTLGSGGGIDLLVGSGRPVDLVADVSGYFVAGTPTAAGAYVARTPARVLDTRTGVGAPRGQVGPGRTTRVALAGRGGLPAASGMSAVVGTLTAVGAARPGYLSVWAGGARPTVSSVNYSFSDAVANQVTVPLDATGGFSLFASDGPVDLVFDVTGYVVAGTATLPGTYVPISPSRIYDSGDFANPPGANTDFDIAVAGLAGVPSPGASAVVANLTATRTQGAGYLTVWPYDEPRPLASNVNWTTEFTRANQGSLGVGRYGRVSLRVTAARDVRVIVDLSGYYLAIPPATPTGLTASVGDAGTPRQAVHLRWDAPSTAVGGYTLRRADGKVPPASPTAGTASYAPAREATSFSDTRVTPGTTYSYALFARDLAGNTSSQAATATVVVPEIDPTDLGLSPVRNLPLPTGAPTPALAFVDEIVCPVADACTGAGYLLPADPADGLRQPYLLTGGPGAWSAAVVPLPADAAGSAELREVDCWDAGSCTAAGTYWTTAGQTAPLIVTVRGTDVSSRTVRLPRPGSPTDTAVTDVSCASATSCLVVGTYRSAGGKVTPLTALVGPNSARWVPSVVPTPLVGLRPAAASCRGAADCVAVGTWGTGAALHGLMGRWDGASWTWADVPGPSDTVSGTLTLLGVDCTTDGCVATGTARAVAAGGGTDVAVRVTGGPGSPVAVALPAVPSTAYGGLVECRAGIGCQTAYRNLLGTTVVGPDLGATSGTTVQPPAGVETPKLSNYVMSCDATLRCALPGTWGAVDNSSARALLTTVVDGVPTTVQVGPVVPVSTTSVLATRVGCAPDGSCVLTGWFRGTEGRTDGGYLQTFSLAGA